MGVACHAGIFWLCEPPSWILDLVTVKEWGKEIFAKGVGVKWKNRPGSTIQDGGIEYPIYYLAFRSKIYTEVLSWTQFMSGCISNWALFIHVLLSDKMLYPHL